MSDEAETSPMKRGKFLGDAVFSIKDEVPGVLYQSDAVEIDGRTWLVTGWLDHPNEPRAKPIVAICLDGHPFEDDPTAKPRFVVNEPIPRPVIEARAPGGTIAGYLVLVEPDAWVTLPYRAH